MHPPTLFHGEGERTGLYWRHGRVANPPVTRPFSRFQPLPQTVATDAAFVGPRRGGLDCCPPSGYERRQDLEWQAWAGV